MGTLVIFEIVSGLLRLYSYAMIAWIILSWIPNLRFSKFAIVLGKLVDPYFAIFRRWIPPAGGIDFSPIVAFFVYRILVHVILTLILPFLVPY